MSSSPRPLQPLRPTVLLPVLAIAVGVVVTVLTITAGSLVGKPAEDFFRDPTATAHLRWYVGSVSRLNGAVWLSAATLAAFVALAGTRLRAAMLVLAGFCAVLGADDMLLLHEEVGPKVGLPEHGFYLVYALTAIVLTLWLAPWRVGAPGWAFLIGSGFLGASVVADVVMRFSNLDVIVEDSTKLIGSLIFLTVPALVFLGDRSGRPAPTSQSQSQAPTAHARAA